MKKPDDFIINENATDDDEPMLFDAPLQVERYMVPYKFSYKSEVLSFTMYNTELREMMTISGRFEVLIAPYGTRLNEERLSRLCDVIDSVNGAVFLPTNCDINALYLGGTLTNLTYEMPNNDITPQMIASFIYYKCEAVLSNYGSIVLFKYVPEYSRVTTYVDVQLHRTSNVYIDEDDWVAEMREAYAEFENMEDMEITESIDEYAVPWWHRDDATTRDYYYGLTNDIDVTRVTTIDLTPPHVNEPIEYPLYSDSYLSKFLTVASATKQFDMKINDSSDDDIVDAHKVKYTVDDVVAILNAALEDELEDDDGDFEEDVNAGDDVIIGGGTK